MIYCRGYHYQKVFVRMKYVIGLKKKELFVIQGASTQTGQNSLRFQTYFRLDEIKPLDLLPRLSIRSVRMHEICDWSEKKNYLKYRVLKL